MNKPKCECPLLRGSDPYFAGMLALDLGLDRANCDGPIKTEIGTAVCRAYQNRLEEYSAMTEPPDMVAEKFLAEDDD